MNSKCVENGVQVEEVIEGVVEEVVKRVEVPTNIYITDDMTEEELIYID